MMWNAAQADIEKTGTPMAKRDQIPPYEIMRSSASSGPAPRPAVKPKADSGSQPDDGPAPATVTGDPDPLPPLPGHAPWWVGSSAPLVLRVPRGLAVLAVVGVLLVIVVAYFVGTVRGAASAAPAEATAGLGERLGPDGFYFSGEEDSFEGTEVEVPDQALEAERREPGLNYMRLIASTREDCERVARFFGARGVAIQLVAVDNGRSWIAYAVKRGYRGDELNSDAFRRYEQQLKALGRKLKNTNNGPDLSTMYPVLYGGPGN